MTASPTIAVVIVLLGEDPRYLRRCLQALRSQSDGGCDQIVVPHDDRFDSAAFGSPGDGVEFVQVPGHRTYAQLRAAGVGRARQAIVAISEDHCSPAPGWTTAIRQLLREDVAAVGGSVDKSGHDSLLNWAIYLCDFARYMNPVPEGPSEYLTDCNMSYRRETLAELQALWKDEFHETTINWELMRRGGVLWLSPEVVVTQQRGLRPGFAIRERFAFGRLFASTRVADVSPGARAFFTAFSFGLPILRTWRVVRLVLARRRNVRRLVTSFPWIVMMELVWAAGELVGYVTGSAGPVDDASYRA